ncbi:MBL fold metallo-hydrolase [Thalassotalea crassostreae]|uniref:MBL fold metallo-hydrolase n=1 Tax=Thalassotalea crassostreae TaxID=1763536 RepID=UPI000837F1A1|nr:MBL fold metallo-hydrolase [Thalassotalea crassostreae]
MKFFTLAISLFLVLSCSSHVTVNAQSTELTGERNSVITKTEWIHGSKNCDTNQDPLYDVYQHDATSFIIRQNKCATFEAPFSYVLIGEKKILVVDTGALSGKPEYSLYAQIERVIGKGQLAMKSILVVHSHSHSDHYEGDVYFEGHDNVEIIDTSATNVKSFWGFQEWPNGEKTIDLGTREITVIPTPGHQEEAISIYDHHSKWLITGDTLYPGYIYVKDWQAYRTSISRLTEFANNHEVSAIMGAHIEKQNSSNAYFPIGTTYQPNEASLDLSADVLPILNTRLKTMVEPAEIVFDDFTLKPLSGMQRLLSNVARWFTQ